jgi:chromosome segregation ATPase
MLERYSRLFERLQEEQRTSDNLRAELTTERRARAHAEQELAALQQEVDGVKRKAARLDEALKQLDEAQAAALSLDEQLRRVRREALEEKLARVRVEQELVALKIERVRTHRNKATTTSASEGPTTAASQRAVASDDEEKP